MENVVAELSWVRVDSALASNHKVLALLSERGGDHALCVYIFALGHSARQGLDGFIPEIALGLIHGRKRDGDLLVAAGMWRSVRGGYEVPDWAEYQPSGEVSKRRTEKARHAAEARWAKRQKVG
jgi:hypothetical protein